MKRKPKAYLAPDVLIRYFTYGVPDIDKLLDNSEPNEVEFVTSDFSLYEAVASLEPGELNQEKLKKILLFLKIVPSPKIRMKHSRKKQLRERAEIV